MLSLLQDAFEFMENGVALLDRKLRFSMCNTRFRGLAFHSVYPAPFPGISAEQIVQNVFKTGFFLPDCVTANDFAQQVMEFVQSCIPELLLVRSDGRVLRGAAKKTAQ